jgi:hypothetical protein
VQEETQSKHSEEALRASELRYRRLLETAQDGILIGTPLWEIGPFKDTKECKLAFLELQQKEYIRYESLPLETSNCRTQAATAMNQHAAAVHHQPMLFSSSNQQRN